MVRAAAPMAGQLGGAARRSRAAAVKKSSSSASASEDRQETLKTTPTATVDSPVGSR